MYESLLFLHSWLRWVVLGASAFLTARWVWYWFRETAWSPADAHYARIFNFTFVFQLVFGVALYLGVSPYTRMAFAQGRAFMEDPILRYWALEHGPVMIVALGIFQVALARVRKRKTRKPYRALALGLGTALAIMLAASPWPGLIYGRKLFRWFYF
ncbi:MAG TPA: hypothetical protein VFV50_02635 [Bdellovibrionales bacterium]|nr:hypothetical protein [Bdellovibrionales bacterium]